MSAGALTLLTFNLEVHVSNSVYETCHANVPPNFQCQTKKLQGHVSC